MPEDTNGADVALLQRKLGRLQEKLTKASEHIKERDDEIKRLKAAQPAEGSQAVTAADAELLTAYKALGTPEALKKAKDDGDAAAKRVKSLERKDAVVAQAREAGVDPDALWGLLEREAETETEVAEIDGKKALQVKRDGKTLTPDEAWGALARALTAAPVAPEAPQHRQRPALPAQRPATKPAPRQVTDDDIDLDILKRHGTSL
jgi:vancomycin resistance protein YoaR